MRERISFEFREQGTLKGLGFWWIFLFSLFYLLMDKGAAADFRGAAFEIPYYTGTIFPTPQRVHYFDEFIPLTKTGILPGRGISKDDPRIMMLRKRIADNGGIAEIIDSFSESYESIIALGDTELGKFLLKEEMLPPKKEGYCICPVRKNKTMVFVLQGYDKLGLTWAVVSFNQLVTKKNSVPVVRKVEVYDFPAIAIQRGHLCSPWSGTGMQWAWFTVQAKLNSIDYLNGNLLGNGSPTRGDNWRDKVPEDWKMELKKIGEFLNPLGIEWAVGISPCACQPIKKIRSKNEDDFAAVFDKASAIALAGGNIVMQYDDHRFPISLDDEKDFGSAREADIHFINKLYAELKKKYPDVKLEFLPPFYWGPRYNPNYPESRDEYLSAVGNRLPSEIKITWTGHSVCSAKVSKKDVEWIKNLIKRKPAFYQNGVFAPHVFGYHYVSDPLNCWRNWYYEGFYNDLESYKLNHNAPLFSTALFTLSDYHWNPAAYEAELSVENAAKKLTGMETWPKLQALNKELAWFDRYEMKVTLGAAKNIEEIKLKGKDLDEAWKMVQLYHPDAVKKWTSLERHVGQQKSFIAKLTQNPDISVFVKQIEEVKASAITEAGVKPDDIFLSPHDFVGGVPAMFYSFECEKRLCSLVYGARTSKNEMRAGFDLSIPPTSDYSLIISAQDDEAPAQCRIRISINGNPVFEGANPFVRQAWSRYTWRIKASFLKEGANLIAIENIEDSDVSMGTPFFIINYVVITSRNK